MTPEQLEDREDPRSETVRIERESAIPLTNRPQRLYDVTTSMLLVWGTRDKVVPCGCIDAYQRAISSPTGAKIEGTRPQPETDREEEVSRPEKNAEPHTNTRGTTECK